MTEDRFIEDRKKEISDNKIIIYGKGTKLMPLCGFTAQVMQIFKSFDKPFQVVNVLDNPEIRSRLKELSEWPTFPQIFVDGEFLGGCDIAMEMYESGELQQVVDKAFDA